MSAPGKSNHDVERSPKRAAAEQADSVSMRHASMASLVDPRTRHDLRTERPRREVTADTLAKDVIFRLA